MNTRITAATLFAALTLTGGCVSQAEHSRAQDQIRGLRYKLDVAEDTLAKRQKELEIQRLKAQNAEKSASNLREELANKDDRFADMQADLRDRWDRERGDLRGQIEDELSAQLREKVRRELDAEYQARLEDLKQTIPTVEVSAYGGLVLENSIFFLPGRHELQPGGKTILDPLIDKFKSAEFRNYSIEIAGHTDSDPIKHSAGRYSDNHILAANRANDVRRYLITRGVQPSRLYITAWGPERPLTPTSPKSKNRRVEIVLHREDAASVDASAPR